MRSAEDEGLAITSSLPAPAFVGGHCWLMFCVSSVSYSRKLVYVNPYLPEICKP